jgi:pyrroline-5-carboxylate reductase
MTSSQRDSSGRGTATSSRVAIIGAGRLGTALVEGFAREGRPGARDIVLCRRDVRELSAFEKRGHPIESDAARAVVGVRVVLLAVQPQQVDGVLAHIAPALTAQHVLVTLATNVACAAVKRHVASATPVVRAMPNIAAALGQSMTCLAISRESSDADRHALNEVQELFDAIGRTQVIAEELMESATALAACGIAFFLRAIRAASQGGIQIGFHPEEALHIAAQTAAGAAALALAGGHPESSIDQVTTPRGCTIAGLNELEHSGFSSALVKGILTAAQRASVLYAK